MVCNDVNAIYQYQKNQIMEEYMQRQLYEKMKAEIVNEILSKIDVKLEEHALNKLNELLNNLIK